MLYVCSVFGLVAYAREALYCIPYTVPVRALSTSGGSKYNCRVNGYALRSLKEQATLKVRNTLAIGCICHTRCSETVSKVLLGNSES